MTEPKNRLPRDMVLQVIHVCTFEAYDFLVKQGHPDKRVWSKFYSLVSKGYLEYGTTVRFPWLTPKGLLKVHGDKVPASCEHCERKDKHVKLKMREMLGWVWPNEVQG